jgi:hypothetical protein
MHDPSDTQALSSSSPALEDKTGPLPPTLFDEAETLAYSPPHSTAANLPPPTPIPEALSARRDEE